MPFRPEPFLAIFRQKWPKNGQKRLLASITASGLWDLSPARDLRARRAARAFGRSSDYSKDFRPSGLKPGGGVKQKFGQYKLSPFVYLGHEFLTSGLLVWLRRFAKSRRPLGENSCQKQFGDQKPPSRAQNRPKGGGCHFGRSRFWPFFAKNGQKVAQIGS